MLVATPMAAEYGAGSDNSGPLMWCDPAMGHRVSLLTGCREMVKLQCVGSQMPEVVLRDCCQKLAGIANDWCRCHDLGSMLDSVYQELGAREGTEVFPGCRKEVMKLNAASVPEVCKVPIPNPSGYKAGVCYWAAYPDA
uniref:Dimeric alpha-amylase inhibitor n=1 Tax=Kengyilia alatavica var. longiglumis TaxID=408160 RepID=T1WHS9_9POAL|nr:dimeric alpha-amylase inhibitor [Kengyilia alatavica var. longiglumis]